MATEKWDAVAAPVLVIAGDASAITLKNLTGADGKVLGGAIDNGDAAARNVFSYWRLRIRFAVLPGEGKAVELFAVKSIDGSLYEDGSAAVLPASTAFICAFPVKNVTTQQEVIIDKVILPAEAFKPLIRNNCGQAFTNTDNENQLYLATYNRILV